MIIRSLDQNHDWRFGRGKQDYSYNQDACAENIQTRLLSFLNDCFFNLPAGIDWFRLLGTKSTEQEIVLSCRAIILQSYGVVQVNSITVYFDRGGRNLSVEYNIDTIFTQFFVGFISPILPPVLPPIVPDFTNKNIITEDGDDILTEDGKTILTE